MYYLCVLFIKTKEINVSIKKQFKQQQVWDETAEMLDTLKDIYNERQAKEYGTKAKVVSKAAIIHNLVMMKLREELAVNKETN